MKRFLLLALTAGLFSPIAAKADDFRVRDTCGRLARSEISGKEAFKRLKLKNTFRSGGELSDVPFRTASENYCRGYIKGTRN
tara:strand:- start:86 stop:331 length:246 start_codon:yes stop_codon:yes gene_type:complete